MKKIYLILILCIFLLSGCAKAEYQMDIKANKNMNIGILLLGKEEFALKNSEVIEQNGYSIIEYQKDGYKGYKISKRILNIDNVSESNREVIYDLLSFNEPDSDLNNIFRVESGFLNNSYSAVFKISDEKYIKDKLIEYKKGDSEKNTEIKFVLNLPSKSDQNNADDITNDGRTLIWNISNTDEKIEFAFTIHNFAYYIVFFAGIIIALVIIIEIILSVFRYKSGTVGFGFKKRAKNSEGGKYFNKLEDNKQTSIVSDGEENDNSKMGMFG